MEIEGTEPPVGRVVLGEGEARSFVGWLELVGLLDSLVMLGGAPFEGPGG